MKIVFDFIQKKIFSTLSVELLVAGLIFMTAKIEIPMNLDYYFEKVWG